MAQNDFNAAWLDEATEWNKEEDKQLNVVIPFLTWLRFNLALPARKIKKKYAVMEAIDMWNLIGRDPRVLRIYAEAQNTQEKSTPEVT
jgi:hypothetical protein